MPQDAQQKKFVRMTTEPVDRLVSHMAVPTVVSMLITGLYNIVDAFFVGHLGPSATGSIGVVFSLMAIIQAVGFGFGHGSGNYISRKLGERDVEEASVMAMVGTVSSFLFGLVITAAGLLLFDDVALWLGSTPTIRPYAEQYMFYILLGAPFFACSLTLNNQLRLQGNANRAMAGIAGGAILNCLLDPLFIFGLHMGVSGAGLSTFISQLTSFVILLYATQRGDAVSLHIRNFRPTRARFVAILEGGTPSLCRQGANSISNIVLNHAMKIYGDNFFAAMTIVLRLSSLIFAVTAGIGQGFQPVCGFNYGARLYRRVEDAYLYTQKLAFTVLISLTILLAVFAPQVVAQFSTVESVISIGITIQRVQCISIPFMGICIISGMLFQNINMYKQATLISLCRNGIFLIPILFILPPLIGQWGVIVAQPLSDLCTFSLALPMQTVLLRKLKAAE
jgi:putative MATE family efflux protein